MTTFETAYDLGYRAGWSVGYGHAQHQADTTWRTRLAGGRVELVPGPSHAALEKVRATLAEHRHRQPCSCPRCTWVARHGGDHRGGAVAW